MANFVYGKAKQALLNGGFKFLIIYYFHIFQIIHHLIDSWERFFYLNFYMC